MEGDRCKCEAVRSRGTEGREIKTYSFQWKWKKKKKRTADGQLGLRYVGDKSLEAEMVLI